MNEEYISNTKEYESYLSQIKVINGDIVQIKPNHAWQNSLLIVTEVFEWGVSAYIPTRNGESTFLQLENGDFMVVGHTDVGQF